MSHWSYLSRIIWFVDAELPILQIFHFLYLQKEIFALFNTEILRLIKTKIFLWN